MRKPSFTGYRRWLFIALVLQCSCFVAVRQSVAEADRADVTRTFVALQLSSDELSDVLGLGWQTVKPGMRINFNEIIAADDRSEVIFKIARDQFAGDQSDPFVFKHDQSFVYFRVPAGAMYINRQSARMYKSAEAYAVIESTTGIPLISQSHEAISRLIGTDRWKGVVMKAARSVP